jgi:glutaredoxin-like protein
MSKLLNDDVKKQIKEYLNVLEHPITMVYFTSKKQPCVYCDETKELLEEMSSLNDKIHLEFKDFDTDLEDVKAYNIEMTPSFVVLDANKNYSGVKFNGIPAGHEINSFLSALVDMSKQTFEVDEALKVRIQNIDKPVNIKVFVTLSCPHCPGAVINAHRLAMLNPNIVGEMIEANTFGELSEKYNVSGVPKIVINEKHELLGNQPIEEFLKYIEQ